MAALFFSFLDHTRWHSTVGRTSLDEWSARRRDLYLTTHNTDNRQTSIPYFIRTCFVVWTVLVFAFCPCCTTHTTQTSMPPARFKPAISASDRPQTHALDRLGKETTPTLLVATKHQLRKCLFTSNSSHSCKHLHHVSTGLLYGRPVPLRKRGLFSCILRSLSPAWRVLGLQMEEQPPYTEGSCEYIE
jgi:hypothetical protein